MAKLYIKRNTNELMDIVNDEQISFSMSAVTVFLSALLRAKRAPDVFLYNVYELYDALNENFRVCVGECSPEVLDKALYNVSMLRPYVELVNG